MKKLGKHLNNNEILTLAQFYERVHGNRGRYYDLYIFEDTVQDDKSVEIIPYTDHSPMMVKKRKTSFEKTIDKLKLLYYNIDTTKKKRFFNMSTKYLFRNGKHIPTEEKTYLAAICIDDEEEEILIEATSPDAAIEKMFMMYGFDSESIIIYHEIDEEYAEQLGYDTY